MFIDSCESSLSLHCGVHHCFLICSFIQSIFALSQFYSQLSHCLVEAQKERVRSFTLSFLLMFTDVQNFYTLYCPPTKTLIYFSVHLILIKCFMVVQAIGAYCTYSYCHNGFFVWLTLSRLPRKHNCC